MRQAKWWDRMICARIHFLEKPAVASINSSISRSLRLLFDMPGNHVINRVHGSSTPHILGGHDDWCQYCCQSTATHEDGKDGQSIGTIGVRGVTMRRDVRSKVRLMNSSHACPASRFCLHELFDVLCSDVTEQWDNREKMLLVIKSTELVAREPSVEHDISRSSQLDRSSLRASRSIRSTR